MLALASISAQGSDDEEEAAGSGSALVAPKEPKARGDWLRDHLAAAIAAHKGKVTAYVVDVATGQELFAHDPDVGQNLASNAKLLTSTAALAKLGGGFRWRTTVYSDELDASTGTVKGNLYVRGRGDPTLTHGDLLALADDIVAHGVKAVEGQLVIDASYFDDDIEPPHYADQPKEQAGFRAPIASFGVAKSAVTVIVSGTDVKLEPDDGTPVKADVKISDKRTKLEVKSTSHGIEVTGQIRLADGSYDKRLRVDDPVKFAAEVFRRALAARGVKIRSSVKGTIPATAKQLAVHDSMPLALAIREMNKLSDNYVAESVLKTLGAESRTTPGPATWADGIGAVRAALIELGVPPTYRYENGSGLYAATEVSARVLVTLLRAAYVDYRIGPDLVASLPVGAADGTLAKRWHGRPAAGRVRAKTGTLDRVITLAGFVAVDGRHPLAFAILTSDIPPGQRGPTRAMADEMVDAMVAYLQ